MTCDALMLRGGRLVTLRESAGCGLKHFPRRRSTHRYRVTSRESAAPANISEYMAAIGRKGGRIGGNRRLETMTKAERPEVAAKAAKAG
jgi:hypothetical protein